MANDYLSSTKLVLKMHGSIGTYSRVSASVYNVETGVNTDTSSSYSVQMYKKHLKANQYNFPNLIGKDAALFYIATDSLAFAPKVKDKIVYGSDTYTVDSYSEHIAAGQSVLYKIVAVRS